MISQKIQKALQGSSAIRAMFVEGNELAARVGRENVYDFSLGNPATPAPAALNEAIKQLVDETDPLVLHGYMDNAGYPDVRQAVAENLNKRFGTAFTSRNIVMTVGAAGGLNIIFKTILDPGDEVIVFAPYFGEYKSYAANFDAEVVEVAPDFETFQPDLMAFEKAINESQIIMFPGGFSAGDEPDGSAKFFATAFRNEKLKEAVMDLLNNRDGLALGICNGFQALIKLGLVPEGKIVEQNAKSPTLTTNRIGRHISKVAYTRIASNLSPWFNNVHVDDIFSIPVSHGEGRFVADEDVIQKLFENGQVATQYVDLNGDPTMNEEFNPNGSYHAIEGITSPDGRVLGKMGHSERRDSYVGINIYGQKDQKIFESGVEYFK